MTENTVKTPDAQTIPTTAEIDALLKLYDDADKNVDAAIDKRNVFGEQIEEMIRLHGFVPKRATKSKRIQGNEWKATHGQSHSIDVDSTAVQRLFASLKEWGLGRFFRRLFRREQIFVLTEGAQELIARLALKSPGIAAELQLLFAGTLRVEGRSTSLKVEPLNEDKKKGAKKGEAA